MKILFNSGLALIRIKRKNFNRESRIWHSLFDFLILAEQNRQSKIKNLLLSIDQNL